MIFEKHLKKFFTKIIKKLCAHKPFKYINNQLNNNIITSISKLSN